MIGLFSTLQNSRRLAQIFNGGIKKYQGRYEDELRYIICLNEERRAGSQKKRHLSISTLSKELDKVFSENARYKKIALSTKRSTKYSRVIKSNSKNSLLSQGIAKVRKRLDIV